MLLRRLGVLTAIGAIALSGCGNNGLNTLGTTTSQSAFRFINGSPDLGNVDVYLQGTNNGAAATNLAYGSMSAISTLNTQSYTVTVTATGSKTSTKLTCPLNSVAASTRYTIVIAGKVAGGSTPLGLQCQSFGETYYSIPSGQFQLGLHQASPALNAIVSGASTASPPPSSVAFGLYPAGTTNWQLFGGTTSFVAAASGIAIGAATNVLLNGVTGAPGMGVYAAPTGSNPPPAGASSVFATTTPVQCVPGGSNVAIGTDTANTFPYQTTTSGTTTTVSQVLMVYAIDAASTTAQLVCAMDD